MARDNKNNKVMKIIIIVQFCQQTESPPVLTKKSKPAEVKAWLEDKGFSKM